MDFLLWQIRKIYSYIVVFKTSTSNRLDLPFASDKILLAHSPYFDASSASSSSPPSAASLSPPSFGYWTHLSDMAQSMLRATGSSELDAEKKDAMGAKALKRLVAWDFGARLRKNRGSAHDALFRESLTDEELSVDLSIASKLDALFKMIADQMNRAKAVPSSYFPRELEAYTERGLSQYVRVLWEYYEAAFANPSNNTPSAPTLQFIITTPVFTD